MNTHSADLAQWGVVAVFESSSCVEDLRSIVDAENPHLLYQLTLHDHAANRPVWYDLCVDFSDASRAFRAARTVLATLLDAADRGILQPLHIVTGADLLRSRFGNACTSIFGIGDVPVRPTPPPSSRGAFGAFGL